MLNLIYKRDKAIPKLPVLLPLFATRLELSRTA